MTQTGFDRDQVQVELERRRTSMEERITELSADIRRAASAGDAPQAHNSFDALLKLADVQRTVDDALSALATEAKGEATPIYTMGSWFLSECFNYLVERDVEALNYVTGVRFGNVFTLDRMVTFDMSLQTAVGARGDVASTHRALIEMERRGHKLHACFHSHPGTGARATLPSSVDLDHQARLEKGGYAAIGGIFSRDGFFRAFSLDNRFSLVVYGKGIEKLDDRLFRVTEVK